jgi:outer membrane protein OmpA-like peptidoglycan-associated protein
MLVTLRNLLLGTAAALCSLTAADAAITTPSGWYLSLGAGANWLPDNDIDEFSSGGSPDTTNEFSWETGYVVAGAVGYDFADRWRAEFEVAYRHNDADGFLSSGSPSSVPGAEIWEFSQMINVFYDFPVSDKFTVSAGAGIGGTLVVFNPGCSGNFESANCNNETDDYVLTGQLIAQAAYRFAERWQLFADYRFMLLDDAEVTNPGDGEIWEIEKTDHALMLGVRLDLQRDGTPPAPSAPPPPATQAKAPKQFIVFFGFNKSNLTEEASRVVADAAAAAKEYGSASIVVVGHTDTVGSNAYNDRLSMRRSQVVKDALAGHGIPASAISTAGRGESELMVQTGDSVKEPQNRRATIDLN